MLELKKYAQGGQNYFTTGGQFTITEYTIRLGDCIIAGMPGEPFCELGLAIKNECNPLTGIPVGYANGYLGYFAPPQIWEKGGCEVMFGHWSKVSSKSQEMILQAFREIIQNL